MNNLLWKILGVTKPTRDDAKRKEFRKAFQRLWVAGTLGAFFTALARNIPQDARKITRSLPLADSILDRSIRYGYLLWLLVYFFVSNVRNEQAAEVKREDLNFDVVQSFLSLIALYFLGFILPDTSYKLGAYAVTNFAILTICVLSLVWFAPDVNRLRWFGVLVSGVALLMALFGTFGWALLFGFLALQVIMWVLLCVYVRFRLDTAA